MSGIGWLGAIIIGGLAGWAAEKIMNASHGLLINIVLGILGALILNAILGLILGGTLGGWLGQFVVALVGACLLIWGYRKVRAA